MNRFSNQDHYEQFLKDWQADLNDGSKYYTMSSIFADEEGGGDFYQDLFDMLHDDYRCGYHGRRKTKLLLYIVHRAYREYGVILHTGDKSVRAEDNSADPFDLAEACESF